MNEATDIYELENVGRQISKSTLSWKEKQTLNREGNIIAENKF